MRQWVGLQAVGGTLLDSCADDATLRAALQSGVSLGAHDGLVRVRHVPDPHVELFALGVLGGLGVVLATWQLAGALVLEINVVLLLTTKS